MTLGIVAQHGNDRALALAGEIRSAFDADDNPVRIDEMTADGLDVAGTPVDQLSSTDLVVSIGGDGTFLFTARNVGETPIIGVNLGEVGFLNAVAPDEAVSVVREHYPRAVDGSLEMQTVPRLVATFEEANLPPALNEIVLHATHRGRSHQLELAIEVDGEEYTTERADGAMVSTPTGTTAYNLSEHGPLLRPDVEALVVNTMSGQHGMPPLAVPLEAEIELSVRGAGPAFVIADGRNRARISPPTTVSVTQSATPAHIAGPPVEFFEALDKLDRAPRPPDGARQP